MATFLEHIPREVAATHGREAANIGKTGWYTSPSGRRIDLTAAIDFAVRETRSYPPEQPLQQESHGPHNTVIEVANETTLSAAKRQLALGYRSVILNFASATHPGGGFLHGARAQEEYLARSTCLYQCIRNNPMYEFHRNKHTPLYTDYVLYSPDVPVFRNDDGTLMADIYKISMITCAAVNAQWISDEDKADIPFIMWSRILKVLAVGRHHQHDAIVLGAWGCGAFANDPREMAKLFHKALHENFRGSYKHVVFAIVDWSKEKRFIGPFDEVFRE